MVSTAVFLDRDGTLTVEKDHLYKFEDWEWIDGAKEAIHCFNSLELRVIVITNQAGIARGLYDEHAVLSLHQTIDAELAQSDAKIDAYYFCPHHPEFGSNRDCNCRKPKPGLLFQAERDYQISLSDSYMIGDKLSDIQAACAAGVRPILVGTGYGKTNRDLVEKDVPYFEDIKAAANFIRQNIAVPLKRNARTK